MDGNSLLRLASRGQSVWLDDIHRRILNDGTLARLIEEDGLAGLTSNPAIFAKAITQHPEYAAPVAELIPKVSSSLELYEAIVIDDIRRAADAFRPVWERTQGGDGYASLEVSPHLARDATATINEARRLWARLERANVMIKVPGTREGISAIRTLTGEGININVTLLFSPERYQAVLDAYLGGLEQRLARGGDVRRLASVASFFLSRIDTLVDKQLDEHAGQGRGEARAIRGRTATALAARAYDHYREVSNSPRWRELSQRGARPQRLLWASTSTKDPRYSDIKYVEDLIAPETVNTMPLETIAAYRDHGKGGPGLTAWREEAPRVLRELAALGIDASKVAGQLEEEGIRKFAEPFDQLQQWLTERREAKGS